MEPTRNDAPPGLLELRISLWGASQVGKTTTLAAYFGLETPSWVEQQDAETRRTLHSFREVWDALRRNQLVAGTPGPKQFSVRHRAGLRLTFRDMRGGAVRAAGDSEEHETLFQSDAALVFCEWPERRMADNETALTTALIELVPDHPTAVVITKCEAHLSEGELLQFAGMPLDFATRHPGLAPLRTLLQRYRAHFNRLQIAPVTVYGWNGGRPAHAYDEFARLIPSDIHPVAVERPFEFILQALHSRTGAGRRL